jgi:RNA polymerase sigma factor (sigma-70 family)
VHKKVKISSLRKALAEKDFSFFEEVYLLYKKEFILFAAKNFSVAEEEADDVFQEAVIALYENIRDGKILSFESTVKTYIFSIAKYKILNIIEKKRHHGNFCSYEMINGKKSETNLMDQENEEEHLKKQAKVFMEMLAGEEKKLIEDFYLHEKSIKEIADELGITEGTARKRKHDILKRLSEKIKGKLSSILAVL